MSSRKIPFERCPTTTRAFKSVVNLPVACSAHLLFDEPTQNIRKQTYALKILPIIFSKSILLGMLQKRFISAFHRWCCTKAQGQGVDMRWMWWEQQWEVPNDLRNFALLTLCGGWISMNIHEYPSVIPQFVGQDHHFSWQTRVFLLVLPHPGRWCARDEPCKFEGWAQGEAREAREAREANKNARKISQIWFHMFHSLWETIAYQSYKSYHPSGFDIPFKLQLSSIFGFIPVANSSFVAYALSTVPRSTDDIDIDIYIYIISISISISIWFVPRSTVVLLPCCPVTTALDFAPLR